MRKSAIRALYNGAPGRSVKEDTRDFYTWFNGMIYRQEQTAPGGYPAVRVFPVYGKRWMTGRSALAFIAGTTIFGVWMRWEKERYCCEMDIEMHERNTNHLPYQTAEIHLRHLVSAYKRHRYEQDNFIDKGYIGMTNEFRKFWYHDDVWRPDLHDVYRHPYLKFGGPLFSYNWALGYW